MTDADAEEEAGAAGASADEATESGGSTAGEAADDAETTAAGAEDGTGEATEGVDDVEALVARVAAHDEALAGEVGDLAARVAALEAEVAERTAEAESLESKLARARADFQNYKRRASEREERLRERATADLVERLLDVRDNLVRALEQDADAGVREGVEATLASFDRVLDEEAVAAVEPTPGDDVDPRRHEVVHREADGDQPPGTIERVFRPGYEQAGAVLRPAQVTVSDADEAEGASGAGDGGGATGEAADDGGPEDQS